MSQTNDIQGFYHDGDLTAESVREIVDSLRYHHRARSPEQLVFTHDAVPLELVCTFNPHTQMILFRMATSPRTPKSMTQIVAAVVRNLPPDFQRGAKRLPDGRLSFRFEMSFDQFAIMSDMRLLDSLKGWRADYLAGAYMMAMAWADRLPS